MQASAPQVVVTGLGTVNALGSSVAEFAAALRAGTTAEALAESGITDAVAPDRIGVVLGGTSGGMLRAEECLRARVEGRSARYGADPIIGAPISVSADV